VDKITGPGNEYVANAKRMVFGDVGIDSFAGPSEIVIIADTTANPVYMAADLLSQAEHHGGAAIAIVTDEALARHLADELTKQVQVLPSAAQTQANLEETGCIFVAETIDQVLALSNELAPEHLELCVADPWAALEKVVHAGAVFLGHHTPEAYGDYYAGPNHTLPTSGTARFFSPLSVRDFTRYQSVLCASAQGMAAVAPAVAALARAEGLEAHARSAETRLNDS